MKQALTIFAFFIFASGYQSLAEKHHPRVGAALNFEERELAAWHMQTLGLIHFNGAASAQKITGSGQRLIGMADFDYTAAPGSQFVDSITFKYSGGRGSELGTYWLSYDTYNFPDIPSPTTFFDSHINYDTMWTFNPPGSNNAVVSGVRTYTTANNILESALVGNYTRTFTYNGSGQLVDSKVKLYDSAIGWYDKRHFFFAYDASGHFVWDSLARFNGTTWVSLGTDSMFYDGNGRIKHIDGWGDVNGTNTITVQLDVTYLPGNNRFNTVLQKTFNTAVNSLENEFLDTIGYTNGAITFRNRYDWDGSSSAWMISHKELRRLNAVDLPDSTWSVDWSGSNADTTTISLVYNGHNSPVDLKYYTVSNQSPALAFESHWYYESISSTDVPTASTHQLEFYPNPVQGALYLKNLISGNYVIYNSLGQIVQAGRCQKGVPLPMNFLSPGQYLLQVETRPGELYTGKVTKE